MAYACGIDIGGTKIEATVFDENWQPLHTRRTPTPHDTYEALIAAVMTQAHWLEMRVGVDNLPLGIGIPGLHKAASGEAITANLPANGRRLRADLMTTIGRKVTFGNDCDLFTYSEALLGAGKDYDTVFGLILGTGIGGGICHGEALFQTVNGIAGEVGHMTISGVLTKEFNLPILTCGCGRQGCFETLASGPGMTQLAKLVMGAPMPAQEIAAQAASGAVGPQRVIEIWLRIVTELIGNLQLTIDPDCIVLGGGLSNIPNVCNQISEILPGALLQGASKPMVTKAKFGDSSGTRGAALAARRKADQR